VSAAIEAIGSRRVVAILRRVADPLVVVEALREGGISAVEITLDSPGALETIARLRDDRAAFLRAGAAAVGVGSALVGAPDVAAAARKLVRSARDA
jgi:2-keto-3-deoxy-6-phosphogluconate aldolase